MPPSLNAFVIRVYGLWLNPEPAVLVSEERIKGQPVVKFPGGGLEFGEGLRDCLAREWREETGLELTGAWHYYTTDFFQRSAFRATDQVLSVYYMVECAAGAVPVKPETELEIQGFRWQPLVALRPETMTLPIDQHVAGMLHDDYERGVFA